MDVKSYQIDMINVGAADAFIIHYVTQDDLCYNVLVDAGNYSDGETIAKNFKKWYPGEYIDLAIVTHPDKDHFGGFVKLIEMMDAHDKNAVDIKKFWINDPGNRHIDKDEVKWITKQCTVNVKARSVYDLDEKGEKNLMEMILSRPTISHEEKFSQPGIPDGKGYFVPHADTIFPNFFVLGPTKTYYEELLPNFRNDELNFFSKEGDSEGKKYLFTGDASIESFTRMYKSSFDYTQNVQWLKLPHHGSKHNLNSRLLKHFNPRVAYVSTKQYEKWLNKCVVNALKKLGTDIYSTHQGGSKLHNGDRDGYSEASKL